MPEPREAPSCTASPPPLILTRPTAQAEQWARALWELGVPTATLPLLCIEPQCDDATKQAKQAILAQLGDYHAIMHVSPNAVLHFWDSAALHTWQQAKAVGLAPRLWSPGPGTSRSLLSLGFTQTCIDQPDPQHSSQFDSEALWRIVATQITADTRVLIVRGSTAQALRATPTTLPDTAGHGRQWLSQTLQQQGARVELLSVYERRAPIWTPAHLALVQAAAQGHGIWLFNSSEAAAQLAAQCSTEDWRAHTAIATHPRIAQTLRQIGFTKVHTCLPTPEVLALTWAHANESPTP